MAAGWLGALPVARHTLRRLKAMPVAGYQLRRLAARGHHPAGRTALDSWSDRAADLNSLKPMAGRNPQAPTFAEPGHKRSIVTLYVIFLTNMNMIKNFRDAFTKRHNPHHKMTGTLFVKLLTGDSTKGKAPC